MRQQYQTKPYEKLMEAYQRFDGGLNTMSAPDAMLDTELTDVLNMDIGERGSLKRRCGIREWHSIIHTDGEPTQGYFRYYKTDGTFEEMHASGGRIYKNFSIDFAEIEGLPFSFFQPTRPIDSVQIDNILYIATGTKLVTYDGTTLKVVDPYLPTTMEMTYIGSNILADDPEGHLQDTIGLVPSIDYILPKYSKQYSYIYANVFITRLQGVSYQCSIQWRPVSMSNEAWGAPGESKWSAIGNGDHRVADTDATPNRSLPGKYEVRVLLRETGKPATILSEYRTEFEVKSVIDEPQAAPTIHKCNRILLHWGRMMMYGDPENPTRLYMSHLNAPNYVPALLNLEFDNPRREALTTIIPYRNSLLAFTKSSTQALYGTGPDDYRRVMLHTDLGCISPYGAVVMKNHVGFLSLQGVYALKTMGYTDDKASVEKLDSKIANIVPIDTNAIAVFNDNQLQFTFPNHKTRLRFYHDLGSWTKDYSDYFDFTRQYTIDGEVFSLGPWGVYVFDTSIYHDNGYNYTNLWESKYLSFGQPYHKKKLKEIHILTAPKDTEMNCKVFIYADEEAVITPDKEWATIENGAVVWNVTSLPNLHASAGTDFGEKWELGDNVFGKTVFALNKLKLTGNCKRTRIRVVNTDPTENQFIGFAYIFKARRPS